MFLGVLLLVLAVGCFVTLASFMCLTAIVNGVLVGNVRSAFRQLVVFMPVLAKVELIDMFWIPMWLAGFARKR